MSRRPDPALASLLLTNRLVDSGTEPLRSREYWELLERVGDPAALLGQTAESIAAEHGLAPDLAERLAGLLDAGTALALHLDDLERQSIRAVSPFDEAYPARLREQLAANAPPVLYAAGPTGLLHGDGLAVVGSRNVTDAGARVAQNAARLAARHGRTVVSGGAKGTDQLAMSAAYEAGGSAVGVLADPLLRKLHQPDVRRAISAEQACLVTPYKPTAAFSVARAMGRNKIVYALASVTLVVAADAGTGGTWAGADEALKRGWGTVAVWMGDGAGPGNEQLVERGGVAVTDVEAVLSAELASAPQAATQLRLA